MFERDCAILVEHSGAKFAVYTTLPAISEHPHESIEDTKSREDIPMKTLFVFHHGAGFTAQTWQPTCDKLSTLNPAFDMLAFDCRGHGATESNGDLDLSLERLSWDCVGVVEKVVGREALRNYEIVLVGHSMGGAVVVEVARAMATQWQILGAVVVDVVEGTALQALAHMDAHISSRPRSFATLDEALQWASRPNSTSSRNTIRSQLKLDPSTNRHVWITDLSATRPFWEGWFTGLSEKFLSLKVARLLILANTDRLDKPLTIGQIQGKFQMSVIANVGHLVQEDAPDQMAKTLHDFWKRNSRSNLPPAIAKKLRPV